MHAMEIIQGIKRTTKAMSHNVNEAERHIKKAHELRDTCRMSADWDKEMAHRHLEFNSLGRALYDKQMRDLMELPGAEEYIPGIKAAYNDWISDINAETAEVMAMIQMYK